MRRRRAGRSDPRPGLRPRGRARARLQHGLPQGRAGSGRRLRRALPRRRRRRRRLLAAAEGGPDARLQRRRRRHAPPPRLDPPLPAPAVRLRQGRGAAGAQVADPLQPGRRLALVGADLRGALDADAAAAGDGPLRDLGQRPLPIDLRAAAGPGRGPAGAGGAAARRSARGAVRSSACSGGRCWSAAPLFLAALAWILAVAISQRLASPPRGAGTDAGADAEATGGHLAALPPAALRAPGRAASQRALALASAGAHPTDPALAAHGRGLERKLARPIGLDRAAPGRARRRRRLRPQRRPVRSLGPRPAGRRPRRGEDTHRGRGARPRQAAAASADLAAHDRCRDGW